MTSRSRQHTRTFSLITFWRGHVPSVFEHQGSTLRRNSSSKQCASSFTTAQIRWGPSVRSCRDALGSMSTQQFVSIFGEIVETPRARIIIHGPFQSSMSSADIVKRHCRHAWTQLLRRYQPSVMYSCYTIDVLCSHEVVRTYTRFLIFSCGVSRSFGVVW